VEFLINKFVKTIGVVNIEIYSRMYYNMNSGKTCFSCFNSSQHGWMLPEKVRWCSRE